MKVILEKQEIKNGEELRKKLRDIRNDIGLDHRIDFTTEEIFDYLRKNQYRIYIIDIHAEIYTKVCDPFGGVSYENPEPGIAQNIVAVLPDDEIPTTEKGVSKYNIYNTFDKVMKKKLLEL